MRFKKSLKKPFEIAEYIQDILINKFGFDKDEIDWDMSGLSSSQYLNINNWEEMTHKSSPYNDDALIVRISSHDLPPSYDRLHGYFDYDLKADNDSRYGSNGDAIPYYEFLDDVQSLVPLVRQPKIELQEWMKRLDEIYEWYKQNSEPYYFPFFELKFLSKSERQKRFKNLLDTYPNIDILKYFIKEYSESNKKYLYYYEKMIKDLF